MTASDVAGRLDRGEIGPTTVAYGPGFGEWRPVGDLPEIIDLQAKDEATSTLTSGDSEMAVQATPPSASRPASPAALPTRPQLPPTVDASPAYAPQSAQRSSAPAGGGSGQASAPAEPVRQGEEAGATTLVFAARQAAEYSRINFLLRLFGFYYMLYMAHLAMWVGYRIAAAVASMLNLILALITGRHHRGLVNYLQRFLRFEARMGLSVMGLTEDIPHIDVNARRPDFPVDVATEPGMDIGAGDAILRLSGIIGVMLIPHFLALGVLGFGAFFAFIAGFLAVIFTGNWPAGIFNFLVGLMRWNLRVLEYVFGLSTKYPPFSLS